jgi:hypothetical protein
MIAKACIIGERDWPGVVDWCDGTEHSYYYNYVKDYYDCILESPSIKGPDIWALPVDSVEGILAELDREIRGVKDLHDRAIEEYFRNFLKTQW